MGVGRTEKKHIFHKIWRCFHWTRLPMLGVRREKK